MFPADIGKFGISRHQDPAIFDGALPDLISRLFALLAPGFFHVGRLLLHLLLNRRSMGVRELEGTDVPHVGVAELPLLALNQKYWDRSAVGPVVSDNKMLVSRLIFTAEIPVQPFELL